MVQSPERYIVHVDMDAFFAAVEQRDNPDLKGKPVVVGAHPKKRGVVSTCSYEARAYGIRSAMPSRTAYRLCPHAVFLPVNMKKYRRVSSRIMEILRNVSPVMEQVSVDEAFLDVTGQAASFDSAALLARQIKERVKKATGLTASVGVADNKFLAKLASDLNKPDGLTVIRRDACREILAPLPVSKIWGVGNVAEKKLGELGIHTIGELLGIPRPLLEETFGKFGSHLYRLARGEDDSEVVTEHEAKSVSSETTFEVDVDDVSTVNVALEKMCATVARRLRSDSLKAKTVTLKVRFQDFTTITRSRSVSSYLDDAKGIFAVASGLLAAACEVSGRGNFKRKVRLVGVAASNLRRQAEQMDLFSQDRKKTDAIAKIVQDVRDRFGKESIVTGRSIAKGKESKRSGGRESEF
jgi:DNA polymerase-4